MSAVPVIDRVVDQTAPISYPITTPRIRIQEPIERIRRAPARKAAASKDRTTSLFATLALFSVVASVVSAAASLSGQVLLEGARRSNIRASERGRVAARESAALRDSLLQLTSAKSVEDWALGNGYVQAEGFTPSPIKRESGLVALRR